MKRHYKTSFLAGSILLSSVVLHSCRSVKPCGEQYTKCQKFFQSKKFKEAKHKMDSLCDLNYDQSIRISSLIAKIDSINKLNDSLIGSNDFLAVELERVDDEYKLLKSTTEESILAMNQALAKKEEELSYIAAELASASSKVESVRNRMREFQSNIASALNPTFKDKFKVENRNGRTYLTTESSLFFSSGSDRISKEGTEFLDSVVNELLEDKKLQITIEGHTDNIPIKTNRFQDNLALSAARSNSVSRYLLNKGIAPERLLAAARGEYEPIADNSTEAGRAINRRTEIIISPNLEELYTLIEPANVEGVKIIAEPVNAERFLIPMDEWMEIRDLKKKKLIEKIKSVEFWSVGNTNEPFKYDEDNYMVVIIHRGELNKRTFNIILGKDNICNLKIVTEK